MSPRRKAIPKYHASVTQEDIDVAKPSDSSHCMIARAIARAVGCPERFVTVDLQLIEFSDPSRHLRVAYLTPDVAQQRLLDFDAKREVLPFDLTLRRPVQVRTSDLGRPAESRAPLTPSEERKVRARQERKTVLTQRRDRGESLTSKERAALSRMEATDRQGGLVQGKAPYSPTRVVSSNTNKGRTEVRVEGGARPIVPTANRTLSNRKGRRRQYGLRQADA
jgi:hypothetical protein